MNGLITIKYYEKDRITYIEEEKVVGYIYNNVIEDPRLLIKVFCNGKIIGEVWESKTKGVIFNMLENKKIVYYDKPQRKQND